MKKISLGKIKKERPIRFETPSEKRLHLYKGDTVTLEGEVKGEKFKLIFEYHGRDKKGDPILSFEFRAEDERKFFGDIGKKEDRKKEWWDEIERRDK